ncbi:MAG: recombination protein O N-terminal domain-containing protein [Alphaproteobacteria bacterium]|nr:recombination protein O N-terminal domain-containing protein [Alphaproteobacteria bacterium]
MVSWSDIGIVLSSRKHGEKYKIINVFTKGHGRFSAMSSVGRSGNTFAIFSNVELAYSAKTADNLGFWKLLNERQNWIFSFNSQNHILVCQAICYALDRLLPVGAPYPGLFAFVDYVSRSLQNFSEKGVLLLYVYFENILVGELGFRKHPETLPKLSDFSALPDVLNGDALCSNAYNILLQTGKTIEENLRHIGNCYRDMIVQSIMIGNNDHY